MWREEGLATLVGIMAALAGGYAVLRAWPEITVFVLQAAMLGALYVVARG